MSVVHERWQCGRSAVHVAALSDTGDDATVLRSRTTVLSRGSHSSDRPRPRSAQPPVAPHTRRRWEEPRASRAEPTERAGLHSSSLLLKPALFWLMYVEQQPAYTSYSYEVHITQHFHHIRKIYDSYSLKIIPEVPPPQHSVTEGGAHAEKGGARGGA